MGTIGSIGSTFLVAARTVQIARCAAVRDYLTNIQKSNYYMTIANNAHFPMARAVFPAAYMGAHAITHVCSPQNICM